MAKPLGFSSRWTAVVKSGAIAALLSVSGQSHALNSVTGRVLGIYVSGAGNYAFRVYIEGVAEPCGTGQGGFAYVESTNGNYKGYVAGILLARERGATVNWYVAPLNGQCAIVEYSY